LGTHHSDKDDKPDGLKEDEHQARDVDGSAALKGCDYPQQQHRQDIVNHCCPEDHPTLESSQYSQLLENASGDTR
jgi:hypothetical protein